MSTRLPYFDVLFDWREAGDPSASVFERFIHWGVWWPSDRADGSPADLVRGMERLNTHVLSWAQLTDDQDVLDVGCGFGGTLASIAARHARMRLVGLNIDPRQLEAARSTCTPPRDGTLDFVEGNAVAMPFAKDSFDRVLAIECAFHFPSRLEFLREAARVLRPGGRLLISDFVPLLRSAPDIVFDYLDALAAKGFGSVSTRWPDGSYAQMAREVGLRPIFVEDLTKATLPTYPALLALYGSRADSRELVRTTRLISLFSRLRLFRYQLLGFERPTRSP